MTQPSRIHSMVCPKTPVKPVFLRHGTILLPYLALGRPISRRVVLDESEASQMPPLAVDEETEVQSLATCPLSLLVKELGF